MTSSPAEGALVGQAQAGSTRAFSQLVEMHQQAVRAFLRRLCGNWAEGDDLAQETFVTAWLQFARFDRRRDLRPWLCGLAYRKFLASRRAFFRRVRRETEFAGEQEIISKPMSDLRLDLTKAMNELSPEQRAAVALCLAADFSHAEAAETLGIPLGTVKSHVQRGRAKLLTAMGEVHE
jgi:RNA polymerase sigma-70 factor (ECF subfamily)